MIPSLLAIAMIIAPLFGWFIGWNVAKKVTETDDDEDLGLRQ